MNILSEGIVYNHDLMVRDVDDDGHDGLYFFQRVVVSRDEIVTSLFQAPVKSPGLHGREEVVTTLSAGSIQAMAVEEGVDPDTIEPAISGTYSVIGRLDTPALSGYDTFRRRRVAALFK